MLYVIVGIAAGVGLVLGWLPGLAVPVDHVLADLVRGSESATSHLIGRHLGSPGLHGVALVLAVLVPVVVPGLLAMALVVLAQASFEIRRVAAFVAILAGLASFLVLPASSATVLLVAAVVFALVSSVATGLVLVVPLVAGATVLAVRNVDLIARDRYPAVAHGAHSLVADLGGSLGMWKALLVLAALLPFVAAGARLLRHHDRVLTRAAHAV